MTDGGNVWCASIKIQQNDCKSTSYMTFDMIIFSKIVPQKLS